MKSCAFVFKSTPHGHSAGREGLDALLGASAINEALCAIFIGDGVLQLLQGQQPERILARHYAPTFKMLELYDIDAVYVCEESMRERGVTADDLLIPHRRVSRSEIRQHLNTVSHRFVF